MMRLLVIVLLFGCFGCLLIETPEFSYGIFCHLIHSEKIISFQASDVRQS